MAGLMAYLSGEGRANEHTEQHLVAGDPSIMAMHGENVLDRAEALVIAQELNAQKEFFGVEMTRQVKIRDEAGEVTGSRRVASDVWHCSLSLRAEEGQLTDEQWGRIATDFVDRMGFAGATSGKPDCLWVAVRHGLSKNGNDHIHIAVSAVRADGTKAHIPWDKSLSQRVSRQLEAEYGLEPLHAPERELGERGVQRGAREAAERRGAVEVDAHRLERAVRSSAAASVDEGEFVRRMRQAGVLIRPRYAAGRDDVVAGYSVALRPEKGAQVVWHGGGKLARDLTLPELRKQWPDSPEKASEAVQEWRATAKNPWQYQPVRPGREIREPSPELWAQYARDLAALGERVRAVPPTDRAMWAHVARETSGAFAAWSQRLETTPGPLAEASRTLARSAHLRTYESRPRPVASRSLAGAAMVLMQVSQGGKPSVAEALILRELAKLSRSVHDMHEAIGDAHRARDVRVMMQTQLTVVRDRMPALTTPETSAVPGREARALTPEEQQVRERMLADQGWTTGSPIPKTLTKTKRDFEPAASLEPDRNRDGRER